MTALPTGLTTGIWNVDTAHSEFAFVVRHAGVSKVRGKFAVIEGVINAGADLESTTITASADVSTISTGNEQRDGHMQTADFFDSENNPRLTFTSTSLSGEGDEFTLTGDLSIRGVTKSVDFTTEFNGIAETPTGDTVAGFSAEAAISRKDFDINFDVPLAGGNLLVADKIKIHLEIEAIRA